jgi:hypothetical protein
MTNTVNSRRDFIIKFAAVSGVLAGGPYCPHAEEAMVQCCNSTMVLQVATL